MSRVSEIWRRMGMLIRREAFARELEEEMRLHRELKEKELLAEGGDPEEARYAANRQFGNALHLRERGGDAWGWRWLEEFARDVRFASRTLRHNPGFTIIAVLTLALGIGANTAIFTLIDAVMLKSLPVTSPTQLYRLGDSTNCCVMTGTQNGGSFVLYSHWLYEDLRDHTTEFSDLAAFTPFLTDLSVRSAVSKVAEPYKGEFVSGNYFRMFGVDAFAGRTFTTSDDRRNAAPAAVMNYHTWQQRFGSNPSVIGATLTINTVAYTLVGVAPAGFYGDTLRSDPPDFWLPLGTEPLLDGLNSRLERGDLEWLYLAGRLKQGAEPEQVQARLTVELQEWLESHTEMIPERDRKDIARQHVRLTPAASGVNQMQSAYDVGLRLLVTLSGLVLLVACANIANLLLARGAACRSQTAVRLALGAPRRRLMRQMLTESVLLALAGGAAGLYVAYAGTHAILLLAFRGAQYVPIDARPSLPVLCFALLLSLVTGIVFGIAPAWMASGGDPAEALRGAGRSLDNHSSLAQKPLIILQVSLSTVLLIGAGLLTKSLRNLEGQHFGFVTEDRLIVRVNPALAGYTPEKLYGLYHQLERSLAEIPGVRSASLSGYSPLGTDNWNGRVYIEGRPPDFRDVAPSWNRVGAHYFESIGTRLVRGRVIEERDTPSAQHVAVINERFAHRFFPNEDPIGQHFGMGDVSHSGDYEIVGIVEDAKYQDTRGPAYATFFLPLLQTPPGESTRDGSVYIGEIELHIAGKPEKLEPLVREALAGIDANLTVLGMTSFADQVSFNFNQERLIARLTGLFGLLALALACIGLYGVTAYGVARRRSEIGIRMALGADRGKVVGMVVRGAMAQIGIGLLIGIPVALAGGRALAHQLFGVKSYDPVVLSAAVGMLVVSALVAGLVPAVRAASIDPMEALRSE